MPWGNIQLRAQGTAMCLYWLLLRPRTTLEEQAGVEKAEGKVPLINEWQEALAAGVGEG